MNDFFPPMQRVNRTRRCPICGRPDWCLLAPDGCAAICPRVEEGAKRRCGAAGWLHVLREDAPAPRSPRRRVCRIGSGDATHDFTPLAAQYSRRLSAHRLAGLADALGVSSEALRRLGAGWSGSAYSFPMWAPDGRMVGIHLRYRSGRKAAERGSRNGLFRPDPVGETAPLVIAEGMSDTAAALDLGFAAAGRPGCHGGVGALRQLARGRSVVIVGDNDPPTCPGAAPPGRRGAKELARALAPLCPSVRLIFPPAECKDLRAWTAAGLGRRGLMDALEAVEPVEVRATVRVQGEKARRGHGR